jgi:hypothetical protein
VGGIEQSRQACRTITQNWQKLVEPHQSIQVWQGDVLRVLQGKPSTTYTSTPPTIVRSIVLSWRQSQPITC